MKIGKVKWFGTYNSFYGNRNDYGFLEQFDSKENIYFHKTGIDKSSKFLSKEERIGDYVVYEETNSLKNNKPIAVNVKLLEELSYEELEGVYHINKSNKEMVKILRNHYPQLFENESLEFFIPYLNERSMSTLFIKKCMVMGQNNLKDKLKDHLMDSQVKELLIHNIPQIYLHDNMEEYFEIMATNKAANELFWKRYQDGYFKTSLLKEYINWTKENDIRFEEIIDWNKVNWNDETIEDIKEIILLIKELKIRNISVQSILIIRPDLIFSSVGIYKIINKNDILGLNFNEIVKTNAQLDFIMTYMDTELKRFICEQVCDNLLLVSDKALEMLSDNRLCKIISNINWINIESNNIDRYKTMLSLIEADVQEQAATKIAISMRDQNMLFDINWWKILTDSVKIRILIYCSNFSGEREIWRDKLTKVYHWEDDNKNHLLVLVLRFFVNIYTSDINKQQENFMNAHEQLMRYLVKCFSDRTYVTHGLNTLLDKCQNGYADTIYFCDAKLWEGKEEIWCTEGYARPHNGRRICPYFKKYDLTWTKYKVSKDYKDQYFADFLFNNIKLNPKSLNLTEINIKNVSEYPYRISAYVNRLLDMRAHMICSRCKEVVSPNFAYSKEPKAKLSATVFHCSKIETSKIELLGQNMDHDQSFYVNYCYHCKRIIDSRECEQRDDMGQYVCMYCGGTQYIERGGECPHCGNTDKEYLESRGDRIYCKVCGYDSTKFKSKIENIYYSNYSDSNRLGTDEYVLDMFGYRRYFLKSKPINNIIDFFRNSKKEV